MSISASIFCSVMSRRAFSTRPFRSSRVIGFAVPRIEVSAAMGAGIDAACSASAVREVARAPAARAPEVMSERREIMKAPELRVQLMTTPRL